MRKMKWIGLVFVLSFVAPFPALAGDFDGTKPLLCAVVETFGCGPGGECIRGTAESIDIPQFLKINFEDKTISSTPESGQVRTTKIRDTELIAGKLILQGMQNGRAWGMIINETSGKVTLSASDDQAGFVVFGACTVR